MTAEMDKKHGGEAVVAGLDAMLDGHKRIVLGARLMWRGELADAVDFGITWHCGGTLRYHAEGNASAIVASF